MIPAEVSVYLRNRSLFFYAHSHPRAVTMQEVARSEHVPGRRTAKPVVVALDGQLALAVVSASQRVDLDRLAEAAGVRHAEIVPEFAFAQLFFPCEPGAEPPLAMFGLPIYADEDLLAQPWLLMRAGSHVDSIEVLTASWMASEDVRPVRHLGIAEHEVPDDEYRELGVGD